jgi:ABC-type sugar transport system ATPase subunit
MLEELFSHQVTHLTGEAGAGKSLLLLWHVGEVFFDGGARTLWIDADNNRNAGWRRLSNCPIVFDERNKMFPILPS